MPRIRCHYDDCVFLEDGLCGAVAVEIDPDNGCMTFQRDGATGEETPEQGEEWEEEDFEEETEEEDLYEDDDEDLWDEDDDDEDYN